MKGKKILSTALALVLMLSMLPAAGAAQTGLSNFKNVNTYTNQTFRDVAAGSWYSENVKSAYEMDLMKDTSAKAFSPNANVTVGSAIALACRLHSIYHTGKADFTQGSPWYQVYVDYAVKNKIITAGQFKNYNANATRRQFAAILAKALPKEALAAKNTVDQGMIPDLAEGSDHYDAIYLLYRAGILTGTDNKGTFKPEAPIGRSSVAAIVSRMAVDSMRQSVTLKAVPVTKITLNKTSMTVETGKTAELTATVAPASASAKTLTWRSSNTAVATVSGSGVVTGMKKGTATITATSINGVKATCSITVTDVPVAVTGIKLDRGYLTLNQGNSERLAATITPSNATDKSVTWKSSNTRVATVSSSGMVTAQSEGRATITATASNGKTASCDVTVEPAVEVRYVTVSPRSLTLEEGKSKSLSASVYPDDAADQSVSWSSSNTSVATVSRSGVVTAVSQGSARITATSGNGKYDYCNVTVKASTVPPAFSTPKLNSNYGPMTFTSYYASSGRVHYQSVISDLTFTKAVLSSSGRVDLTAIIQGTQMTGNYCYVRVELYNNSGKLLDKDYFASKVAEGQDFALEKTFTFDSAALQQASKIKFISYSGHEASSGAVQPEPTPTDPSDYNMYYGFDGIPEFDQFTKSGRTEMENNPGKTASYMYASATLNEVNAYRTALKACGFTEENSIENSLGVMYYYTKGVSGEDNYREVRLSTTPSPYGVSANITISMKKPSNEWSKPETPDPEPTPDTGSGDSTMYYGFDGIPAFDRFTESNRDPKNESLGKTASYMYASATLDEVEAYKAALRDAGFEESNPLETMYVYTKGVSGEDDYREVRLSTTPSPYGVSANITISMKKPSNEW